LLHAGLAVAFPLPDGTQLPGKLDALGKDAAAPGPQSTPQSGGQDAQPKPDDASSGPPVTPLRFTANDPAVLAQFSGQALKITIEVGTTGGDVLTVPVAAVVTNADGHARVHVEAAEGGTRDVQVKLGLTAQGLVQVTPEGGPLEAGDRVVVGTS
jgi:hypothetical protein